MPPDLQVIAGQLAAWLKRNSDDLNSSHSRVLLFKLRQMISLVVSLQRDRERWPVDAPCSFELVRRGLMEILLEIRLNIDDISVRREAGIFDHDSQALLEIIHARLTAPVDDQPDQKQREQLRAARDHIEKWRVIAAKEYQITNERQTTSFYRRTNGRLRSVAAWLNEPCDGSGVPLGEFIDD
jgi:hypothetical protein